MGKYVLLGNWTDQGVREVKDTVKRSRAAREAFAALGVNAREWFFTLGQYDVVLTVDAPDDETLTKATLALAMQGSLRTTTLRGFSEKEMEGLLSALP
ncbi:MAG: GYD domain-containing protein [Rhodoferax sp.]|nr:GYD domain-containing protein [Rhodoferax sp.]